jgi:hypothetical protein
MPQHRKYKPGDVVNERTVIGLDGHYANGSPAYLVCCKCNRTQRLAASSLKRNKVCKVCSNSNPKPRDGVIALVCDGREFTTKQVAAMLGVTYSCAYQAMERNYENVVGQIRGVLVRGAT